MHLVNINQQWHNKLKSLPIFTELLGAILDRPGVCLKASTVFPHH
jgi:hypothetical protein